MINLGLTIKPANKNIKYYCCLYKAWRSDGIKREIVNSCTFTSPWVIGLKSGLINISDFNGNELPHGYLCHMHDLEEIKISITFMQ